MNCFQQLEYVNPKRREKKSTLLSIQGITKVLQPKVNVTEVVDEWKVFQWAVICQLQSKEKTEVFWDKVFQLQSADYDP